MYKLGTIYNEIKLVPKNYLEKLIEEDIKKLHNNAIEEYITSIYDEEIYKELEFKIVQTLPGFNKRKWEEYIDEGLDVEWGDKITSIASEVIINNLRKTKL